MKIRIISNEAENKEAEEPRRPGRTSIQAEKKKVKKCLNLRALGEVRWALNMPDQ